MNDTHSNEAIRLIDLANQMFRQFITPSARWRMDCVETNSKITLTVTPPINEYGKFIGTGGVMFRAIRTILTQAGSKAGLEIRYTVLKPNGRENLDKPRFEAKEWKIEPLKNLSALICANIFGSGEINAQTAKTSAAIEIVALEAKPGAQLAELNAALSVLFHAIGKANGISEVVIEVVTP